MPLRAMRLLFVLLSAVVLAGCPADGTRVNLCANRDLSCDDADACTMDSCDPVTGCVNRRISCDDRSACTADSCSPASGCVNAAISCDDKNQCTGDRCDASLGCMHTDISADCADGDACTADSCNTVSGCVNQTISCDDSNQCTAESCDSVTGCASRPVADGTSCDSGLGQCMGGVCEASDCFRDGDCNDNDACTMDRCNLATNECVNEDISASCDDDNACTEDRCAPATGCVNTDIADRCDDGEECTADSCAPATGCRRENVADGTPCDGGTGECGSGTCVPLSALQYSQDLESLDRMSPSALAEDGWLVFGNVFEGESYLYGYGPFPAPNSGESFSAIVTGQGGGPQGTQQLSVYNDYKNADHANGYLIESTVYRERAHHGRRRRQDDLVQFRRQAREHQRSGRPFVSVSQHRHRVHQDAQSDGGVCDDQLRQEGHDRTTGNLGSVRDFVGDRRGAGRPAAAGRFLEYGDPVPTVGELLRQHRGPQGADAARGPLNTGRRPRRETG